MTRKTEVVVAGVDMEVTFEYEAPCVGDPPHWGAIINLLNVKYHDADLLDCLNGQTLSSIEEQIENQFNDVDNFGE